ncbi:MAG: hypothetical protein PHE24_02125 [Patescibacteria group bacterium]|nr:hypothetical protein [Patescibacteria group bacterium]
MPISNFNAGLGSDDLTDNDEILNEAEENLEEDLDEEADEPVSADEVVADEPTFAKATVDEDEDFDLDEEDDLKVSPPIFAPAAVNPLIADEEESDEQAEEDEAEEEMEADESAFAKATADEPAFAKATADEDEVEESDLTEDEGEDEDEDLEEDSDGDDGEYVSEDSVIVSKSKIILAKQLLENIQKSSVNLVSLFGGLLDDGDEERISIGEISDGLIADEEEGGKVIEGVFNGENMIGPDGKEYSVPANYASKSKLVEGDMLKLTITDRGTFIYKQTKPVERKRLIGKLEKDANGNYLVKAEHKKFRVITASITYYKGIQGDKVVLLVPIAGDSAWGAVDNVIKSK